MLLKIIALLLATNVYCTAEHLVSYNTWMTGHPIYSEGGAVFYAPGIMERTAEYRGMDLDRYVDGVSLMSPADIVDTAQQNHMCQAVQTRGEVVEVGYQTAKRWDMVEWPKVHEWKVDVEVSKVNPMTLEYFGWEPVYYPEWWSAQAELLP